MSPYMSFLLQPFTELLGTFATSSANDKTLWLCILETLAKSFSSDDGGESRRESFIQHLKMLSSAFWRSDKLRQIAPLLVKQVPVCIRHGIAEGKTMLPSCLDALMEAVNDDALLKTINLDLLMHTRSDDVRLRTFTLTCSETLWRAHGGKLLGMSNMSDIHVPNVICRLRRGDDNIHS